MRDPERIYTPKRDETAGLDLFAQRIASPEAAHSVEVSGTRSVARPVARIEMPGAGQAARAEARERARPTVEDAYRRIAMSLEGHGPQTRKELAETCGMPVNTVNARVAEMRSFHGDDTLPASWRAWGVLTSGRRDGQSVVHLARTFRAPTPEPETDR